MENEIIKSETFSYYSLIAFGVLFGLIFFIGGLINLLDPTGTVNVNGVIEQSDLANTSPFLILGLAAIGGVTYYRFNLGLAALSSNTIKLNYPKEKVELAFNDVKFAEVISYINGYAIKLHMKDNSAYRIQTDRASFKFSDFGNLKRSYYRTKMWERLKQNNVRLIEE